MLKWILENGGKVCRQTTFGYAARNGHLHIMTYLYDSGFCSLQTDCYSSALEGGSVAALQWLFDNKVPLPEVSEKMVNSVKDAAASGRIDALIWISAATGTSNLHNRNLAL